MFFHLLCLSLFRVALYGNSLLGMQLVYKNSFSTIEVFKDVEKKFVGIIGHRSSTSQYGCCLVRKYVKKIYEKHRTHVVFLNTHITAVRWYHVLYVHFFVACTNVVRSQTRRRKLLIIDFSAAGIA